MTRGRWLVLAPVLGCGGQRPVRSHTFAWLAAQPEVDGKRVGIIGHSEDLQVPADANLARIEAALKRAGHRDVTIEQRPGLDHLFQHAELGVVDEYATFEETFDPDRLDLLAGWLHEKAGL